MPVFQSLPTNGITKNNLRGVSGRVQNPAYTSRRQTGRPKGLADKRRLPPAQAATIEVIHQAVIALRRVVNNNRLSDRTRDDLERDLERMRELRWRSVVNYNQGQA